MKKPEESAISEAIRMLNFTLEVDKDAGDDRIKLDPGTRRAFDSARIRLEEIFDGHEAKITERFNRLQQLRDASKDLDIQMSLFDEKGNARGLDDNGKLIPTQRADKALNAAVDGIDPKDGTQGTLDSQPPGAWKIPSGVPPHIEAGLVQALNDGAGRTKACEQVAKSTGQTKAIVEVHFDQLVRKGVIAKAGKNWLAETPDAPPPNSNDPDVVATSESADQPLITTAQAEAQAA